MAAITIWVPSTCSNIQALGKELVGTRQGGLPQPPGEQIGSLEPESAALWKANDAQ